jgi:hypothetical protein
VVNKVYKDGRLAAVKIDFLQGLESTTFFTDAESPLQVGIISKKLMDPVKAHRHNTFQRNVLGTSEFLYVLEGSMTVTVFDENFQNPETLQLSVGSGVLLLGGAHSIEFEESTKLIEVKQGPYSAELDKVYLSELN